MSLHTVACDVSRFQGLKAFSTAAKGRDPKFLIGVIGAKHSDRQGDPSGRGEILFE